MTQSGLSDSNVTRGLRKALLPLRGSVFFRLFRFCEQAQIVTKLKSPPTSSEGLVPRTGQLSNQILQDLVALVDLEFATFITDY